MRKRHACTHAPVLGLRLHRACTRAPGQGRRLHLACTRHHRDRCALHGVNAAQTAVLQISVCAHARASGQENPNLQQPNYHEHAVACTCMQLHVCSVLVVRDCLMGSHTRIVHIQHSGPHHRRTDGCGALYFVFVLWRCILKDKVGGPGANVHGGPR